MRERGIALLGPDPRTLVAPVPADALHREIVETMRTWREQLLANPAALNNRFYQPCAVLSYCRMLHTLQIGRIESKPAGAAWAKLTLDGRWGPLIQQAMEDRPGDAAWKVQQEARSPDLESTWEFMQYALALASELKADGPP